MILHWLPKAIATREALFNHIAKVNPQAAIEHDERIEKHTDKLVEFPNLGRRGRRGTTTRELVIPQTHFVVVYRVKPRLQRVEILRVLHTSQQWP